MLTLAALATFDWAVLGAYLVAMIALGFWLSRGAEDERGYVLANRSMPAWAVGLSMLATAFGTLDFIGLPQLGFGGDLSYLSLVFAGWAAMLVIAGVLLPAFYGANTLTIYGYLGQRFGPGARLAGGVLFLLGKVVTSGAGMFVASIALGAMIKQGAEPTLGELLLSILIVGVVGTLYTAVGGIRTVIWTDVVQMLIIFGASILSIIWLIQLIPLGPGEIFGVLSEATVSGDPKGTGKLTLVHWGFSLSDPYSLLAVLFGGTVFFLASFGTDHNFTQRLLTCPSAKKAGAAVIGGFGIGIVSQVLMLSVGLLLFVYNDPTLWGAAAADPRYASGATAYPDFILNSLPVGVTGLIMAALFAVMMSSFDSTVASIGSSFVADIVRPLRAWRNGEHGVVEDEAWASRPRSSLGTIVTTAATGAGLTTVGCVAAVIYGNSERTLIDFVLGLGSLPHGSFLGVFLCGVLTRRGNVRSVVAAIIAGIAVWVLLQPTVLGWITEVAFGDPIQLAWTWWATIGTIVSFSVCCMGRQKRGQIASDR